MDLISQLRAFQPWNEQEDRDREALLRLLENGQAFYGREDPAHLTASAWVVSPDREKALMAYHNLYDSWAWLGGHADGMEDLRAVAEKEVREESGLEEVMPLGEGIFSLEILTVDGHEKRGKYVSSHLHLNVTYLFEADPAAPVRSKPDENKAVAWFGVGEVLQKSTEPWFCQRIYSKLMEKVRLMESNSSTP